jgi:UDP-N-acetylmuramoyl-tripeptide--D-alanyl-D-alanine ligase
LVFLNADNDYLCDLLSDDDSLWVTPYSTDEEKQYQCISGEVMECTPYLKFRWRKPLMELEDTGASTKWHKVQTQLIGSYNIDNLLAAIAVGINFGVDRKKICAALEEYVPSNNRSQMTVTAKNHLIVDAYNANPTSMHAALDNFSLIEADHKMAILGQMGELGEESDKEHRLLVDRLESSGYDDVWLVGDNFRDIPCPFRKFHDVEEVKAAIAADCPEGFYILIKGSNSNKLFQLPELL